VVHALGGLPEQLIWRKPFDVLEEFLVQVGEGDPKQFRSFHPHIVPAFSGDSGSVQG
jgi:hypothetical protein